MQIPILKTLSSVIIAVGLSSPAHSSCITSTTLGEYVLGDLGQVDRSWAISDQSGSYGDSDTIEWDDIATIGDSSRLLNNAAELEQEKNRLIWSCEANGAALIIQMEKYFENYKEGAADRFDSHWQSAAVNCTDARYCLEIRDAAIKQDQDSIDQISAAYQDRFEKDITDCKKNFETVYDALADQMCY